MGKRPRSDAEIDLESANGELQRLRELIGQGRAQDEARAKEARTARQKLDAAQERQRRANRDLADRKTKARKDADARGTHPRDVDPSSSLKNATEDITKYGQHLEKLSEAKAFSGSEYEKQLNQQLADASRKTDAAKRSLETQAHQSALDRDSEKSEIDRRRLELAEEDSKRKAEEFTARRNEVAMKQNGEIAASRNALEASKYEAQARAAELKFEWERREDAQDSDHEHARNLQTRQFDHEGHLARLAGEIAERAAEFEVEAHAQKSQIDVQAHEMRVVKEGEVSRQNTTHDVTERIREARILLTIAKEKRTHDTLMDAKLAIIKHHLEKDMLAYRIKMGVEGRNESIEEMAEIIRGIESVGSSYSNK